MMKLDCNAASISSVGVMLPSSHVRNDNINDLQTHFSKSEEWQLKKSWQKQLVLIIMKFKLLMLMVQFSLYTV